ncbi:NFACT RNA binding domain-containing protein [Rhodohalobacter sp. SW132]|uniref:NFACT RNA binding domain-containing protein n=1 Tax=Rhodohalobacter sp. SW132 TaxID=2293433 RepID=UPI001314FA83|nr:NFACT RNA binding domain-containing protein [Rhodohalobacter sp. SW132]
MIFSAHSNETALFADSFRNPKKSNVTEFFEILKENLIIDVSLADRDRWITLTFDNGYELLLKLFGNDPNILLVENETVKESFKSPDTWKGREKPKPRKPSPMAEIQPEWNTRTVITKTDPTFPRHLINPLIEHNNLNEQAPEKVREFIQKVSRQMKNEPEFRVLNDGNICLINQTYLPLEDLKTFENCNDAIRYTYYKTSRERRLSKRIQSLEPRIEDAIKKNRRSIQQLEKADKALERADRYEQFGHILMAHAHESIGHDTESMTVSNFYEDNNPVEIPVKPDLSVAENAQKYYERSTKAKTRVEESKRRLREMKSELEELETIYDSFGGIDKIYEFDDWLDDHRQQLNRLGVLSQNQKTESLPFRKSIVQNYEIWIGKSAKSNDEVTTRAHKEDIWLHARGVGGSHVVIRMNNNKEYPPHNVLMKAAAAAAYNSKARGSSLAPVIYTKRKYVSKPKGAPAGTVRVHREEVEMVQPRKLNT